MKPRTMLLRRRKRCPAGTAAMETFLLRSETRGLGGEASAASRLGGEASAASRLREEYSAVLLLQQTFSHQIPSQYKYTPLADAITTVVLCYDDRVIEYR